MLTPGKEIDLNQLNKVSKHVKVEVNNKKTLNQSGHHINVKKNINPEALTDNLSVRIAESKAHQLDVLSQ